jgi:HPt (histidine-containing phosphotransfer) domain-containing protein
LEVFDRLIALRQAKGDVELVKKRCESFSQSAEAAIISLQRALDEKDTEMLARLARELQTASPEVGAAGLESLASQLVEALPAKDWNQMSGLLTKIAMELGWFQRIIDERVCSGNL